MFKKRFDKFLSKKSKGDFASIEPHIQAPEPTPTGKRFIWPALISSAVFLIAISIALPLALPRLYASPIVDPLSSSVATKAYTELTHPAKPFNTAVGASNPPYFDSLVSFSSRFASYVSEEGNNFIASPLSIATAFSMAYEGADGNTKAELSNLLGYDGSFKPNQAIKNMLLATSLDKKDNEGQQTAFLNVSDALFIDDSFAPRVKENYLSTLQYDYFAEAYGGNLSSSEMHDLLASWLNEKTNDFFHAKGEDFEGQAGLLWLLNAIYLKAVWKTPFEELPAKAPFHNEDGTEVERTYLHNAFATYGYASDSFLVFDVGLGGNMKFRVIVPKEGAESPFPEGTAYAEKERFYFRALLDPSTYLQSKRQACAVDLTMPSFKADSEFDLKEVFLRHGALSDCFTPGIADFSLMASEAKESSLHISQAIHHAGIDVQKDGIEAAAYTIIALEEAFSEPFAVKLDHPFRYAIVDTFGHPLFIGKVAELAA